MKRIIKNLASGILIGGSIFGIGCDEGTDEKNRVDIYDVRSSTEVNSLEGKAIALILDTSGSMDERINGERKIDSAKKALNKILDDYSDYAKNNPKIKIGIFSFEGIGSVVNNVEINDFDYRKLLLCVDSLKAYSNTPIGISLAYAERELDKTGLPSKYIVLLSDGMNNVGRNPREVFNSIVESNKNDVETKLYVVAFNTDASYFSELEKLGAKIYSANSGEELSKVLQENTQLILEKE